MMFEKIEISFLVKSSDHRPGRVISDVAGFLYGRGFVVGDVKDVDCGTVDLIEAVEEWGVDPDDYVEREVVHE